VELELISFKLCPFVQRSVITLLHKQVPHTITYIDLNSPPAWFSEISPLGKVPVLRVDNRHAIFESAVINEFIDEVTPGRMHPEDPVRRAINRAWIEFASDCWGDHMQITSAPEEAKFRAHRAALEAKLARLEQVLGDGPFFNGDSLALVDTAFAPLFMRLEMLNRFVSTYDRESLPRVAAWSDALLALPEVRDSVVPEFEKLYLATVRNRSDYLDDCLDAA